MTRRSRSWAPPPRPTQIRTLRRLAYIVVGAFLPSWHRAVPILDDLDNLVAQAKANPSLRMNPEYLRKVKAMEQTLERVRKGEEF